ncbi:MAG: glycosyltransferase family 2 protein [Ignavibacteriales bacterium]|nr:glycosyltransferase family 2 protein [Ignavibacteriales bacterium]
MLSVIILQYNNAALTKKAIESFQKRYRGEYEIILVDNNSTEEEARHIGQHLHNIRFIQNETNEGFSRGNNRAAQSAKGEILLFLNNDTITVSDFVPDVLGVLRKDASVGIIGPKLLNEDFSFQISCGKLPSILHEVIDKIIYSLARTKASRVLRWLEKKYSQPMPVEWVTGAALFIRAHIFKRLGGFDEQLFMFFEDKDLCLRTRLLGKKVIYFPSTSLIHLGGGSNTSSLKKTTEMIYRRSQISYYKKHLGLFQQYVLTLYLKIVRKYPS